MDEGLFHLSVKMVQRSKGRSATGAIAYRAGVDITDQRTGLRFNYTRKRGVSRREILLPEGAPEAYKDRSTLWNAVEKRETRVNAGVAREFEGALPWDLPAAVREEIGLNFARYIVDSFGVAAELDFHDPHPRKTDEDGNKSKNYHFHLLTSTRVLTAAGFTDKVRELDSAKTGGPIVDQIRAKFAEFINAAYTGSAKDRFVDHRSNQRRGIDDLPQIHVGVNHDGDRAEINAGIIAANEHRRLLKEQEEQRQQEIEALLWEATPIGETVPLYGVETVPAEAAGIVADAECTSIDPTTSEQLVLDFSELMPLEHTNQDVEAAVTPKAGNVPRQVFTTSVSLPQDTLPLPWPLGNTTTTLEPPPPPVDTTLEQRRRYNELEEIRQKAMEFGRATAALHELNSRASSFQRELRELDRPSVFHRFTNSKRWQKYLEQQEDLQQRIATADWRAGQMQEYREAHRSYIKQWDFGGAAVEHARLAKALGIDVPVRIVTPAGNGLGRTIVPIVLSTLSMS
jgi:hypothetical protein